MNEFTDILTTSVDRLFSDLMANGMPETYEKPVFDQLWRAIEDLGISNLLLSEDNGGFGGGWQDGFAIFKQIGFHAIPMPIGETIIAKKLLQDCNMPIPDSAITIGTAHTASIQHDKSSDQILFSGDVPALPWGVAAPTALFHCKSQGECYFALIATSHASTSAQHLNEANESRDSLSFVNAPLIDLKKLDSSSNQVLVAGALLKAAQIAGALEAALQLSVQYVQERKQFGRALSKFQAIQHQIALLAEHAAAASCAANSACHAYDKGDADFEIAAAKLRANRAIGESTSIAHQVHGAIGFTQEHRLHHFTQRLWSWRGEFGNDRHWANYLGQQLVQIGQTNLWKELTNRSDAR
ncbi:acyl-CoA dehydrogenase family protein [Zhongshania aquimaris]|uniref:Acyl-CoA/acyl-ACP dehydrogenase n=1 Tax=Zhongshania aquimaris TaxID=2857107 RepID=A0ABS6VSS9_9GAMM|nr:acyl-CoA dehydrogenase family protein [Zhongshania aquimaris]MBW2941357.1 acyl-CoA/acyl-ACP dehydrogenase [Zhongshania aquimaris]